MASYDLMKKSSREQMRCDREAELAALDTGTWPRNLDDSMRWSATRSWPNSGAHKDYARRMVKAELDYLGDLQRRLEEGKDPSLASWEV